MKKSGFTLIELLTVMAIIALLAAIIFPSLNSARAKARGTQCLSNLKQISLAVMLYAEDNNQKLPPMYIISNQPTPNSEALIDLSTESGTAGTTGWTWTNSLYSYVKNNDIFACPDAPLEDVATYDSCYGINYHLATPLGVGMRKIHKIKYPSNTYLITDMGMYGFGAASAAANGRWYIPGAVKDDDPNLASVPAAYKSDATSPRHLTQLNMLYLDGHTKSITPSEVLRECEAAATGTETNYLLGDKE